MPQFEYVRLYTRDGEDVATAEIPRMTPPVEIIVWGSRMFTYCDMPRARQMDHLCYREAVAYAIPSHSEKPRHPQAILVEAVPSKPAAEELDRHG